MHMVRTSEPTTRHFGSDFFGGRLLSIAVEPMRLVGRNVNNVSSTSSSSRRSHRALASTSTADNSHPQSRTMSDLDEDILDLAEPSAASDSSRPKNRKRKGANAASTARNKTQKKRKVE
jgi:hypothetical protein